MAHITAGDGLQGDIDTLSIGNTDRFVHSRLIVAIGNTITQRRLSTLEAAGLCGTDPTHLTALLHGEVQDLTIDRLAHWLNALGRDMEIIVRRAPPTRLQGRLRVIEPA